MTKNQLLELIQRTVGGEGSTKKYDTRIIELHCSLVYSQLMQDALSGNISNADFFAKTYNVAVQYDTVNDTYYSTLPVQILQLPNGRNGVVSIATTQGKSMEFLPATENDLRLFEDTEAGVVAFSIMDQVFYTVYFDRVDYSSNIPESVDTVKMQLIRSFESIAGTENVNIPNAKDIDFISAVIGLIKDIPNLDLRNKNTDNG